MDIQKLTWFLERTLYYTLLLLTLAAVIYSFATEKMMAGVVALIFTMGVVHKGFARITIPAKSVLVRDGRVVFFAQEKTTLNRFDIISSGQKVVTLPVYGVFDRPYQLAIFFPSGDSVTSCLVTLRLAYGTELPALQCAYDSFVLHENRFADEVKRLLTETALGIAFSDVPEQGDGDRLAPVVAGLNGGLAAIGVEIADASCSFENGRMLARVERI